MNPAYQNVRFRADLPKAGVPSRFVIITACNPDGRDVSDEENAIATERLRTDLLKERHFFFPVTGGSPDFSHAEPGFGVLLPSPEEAVRWGQRFRREAVFWVEEGKVRVVSCEVELSTWASLSNPSGIEPTFRWIGNPCLLNLPKTALFCSSKCPGSAILPAYDQIAAWRDKGRCVISGFHSPVEKEGLKILLRGTSPVIVCPARNLPQRLPPEWQSPLSEGRMLVLSIFEPSASRVSASLAARRNQYVASLADEVWFAHIQPGGQAEALLRLVAREETSELKIGSVGGSPSR
jgi:hypothetical protein